MHREMIRRTPNDPPHLIMEEMIELSVSVLGVCVFFLFVSLSILFPFATIPAQRRQSSCCVSFLVSHDMAGLIFLLHEPLFHLLHFPPLSSRWVGVPNLQHQHVLALHITHARRL